ncbi:MAG: hypothetical protein F6K11_36525 [Leptolyngbya sp. SIO3F4]|nr:hypothetical protein [Leptolyngbya sp. SIO3F4]
MAFVTTNSLPVVSDIDKTGAVNTIIPFTLVDFTDAFTDVDNDPLVTLQILSLPSNGQLTLQGNPVNTNDEIPADQLNNLVFTPATDFLGSTSFDYNASDGYNYALNPAVVNITIEEVEDVDLVVNNPQTNVTQVEAGNEISVSANVAINGGPTSDEAVFVLLLSTDTLPDGGDIQLASAIVPAQTTGASQQINNTITIPEDLEPGEYFLVYYIDAQQAVTETDEINNLKFVRIIILPEGPLVTIMNLITANGDGSNDMLYVRNIESYPDNEVILLDRWGNVVNTFPNYNNDWSPIVGQDIPDFGSYLCIVKLNETQVTVKRMVSIIRDTNQ